MLEFKQQVDPLADAKAWLAHMEKTLAKVAAERVHQNDDDDSAESGRLSPNATNDRGGKGS
jgi:hypothetical protein